MKRVEVFGIQVGSVTSLTIDQEERQMGVVGMKIDKGTVIYDDASAVLRPRALSAINI